MKAKNIFVACAIIALSAVQSKANTYAIDKANVNFYLLAYNNVEQETFDYQLPVANYKSSILNNFKNTFLNLELKSSEINLSYSSVQQLLKSKSLDADPFHIVLLPFNQK